jgi:hypothetical protein
MPSRLLLGSRRSRIQLMSDDFSAWRLLCFTLEVSIVVPMARIIPKKIRVQGFSQLELRSEMEAGQDCASK